MFVSNGPMRFLSALALTVLCGALPLTTGCNSGQRKSQPPKVSNPIEDEFAAAKDRTATPRTLYAMSRLLAARGQNEQARYVLQRVITEEPTFVAAYSDLADLQARDGMTEAAMTTLDKALQLSPDDPILHNNLGMCHLARKEYDKALPHFDAAVAAAPRNPRFVSNLATAQALRGDHDQALATYKRVLPSADAHHNLAVILETQGQADIAAEHYRRAGEKN